MFVERLKMDQIIEIIDEIVPKSCIKIEANLIPDDNPSIELDITDKFFGNYKMYLFDDYLYSKLLLNEIREKNKKLIRYLHKFFGEEYKTFYLKQINEIFY